jgi:hypothetical protein
MAFGILVLTGVALAVLGAVLGLVSQFRQTARSRAGAVGLTLCALILVAWLALLLLSVIENRHRPKDAPQVPSPAIGDLFK